jgi:hypothetical protein
MKNNYINLINLLILNLSSAHSANSYVCINKKLYLKRIVLFFSFKKIISRYSLYNIILEFISFFISIILFPLAVLLKLLNYRIACLDFLNFGNYLTEADLVLKNAKYIGIKKILLFAPKNFNNEAINKIIFSNYYIIFNNFIFGYFLAVLRFYNFLKIDFFRNLSLYNFYYHYNHLRSNSLKLKIKLLSNKKIKNFQEIYLENINFFKKKNINIDYNKFFMSSKKDTNNKVIIFYLRNLRHKLDTDRNVDISSIHKSVSYLLTKNYKIIIASDLNRNILNNINYYKKITYLNLRNYNDRKKLIEQIYISNLFVGSSGGPEQLAQIFNKKILVLNMPNVLMPRMHFKTYILPTLYMDKNKKKYLPFSRVAKNILLNASCLHISGINIQKNIFAVQNLPNDIYLSVKFMISNNKKNKLKIKNFSKNSLIQFVAHPFYQKYKFLIRS